jgi:hypothetical protein
VTRLDEAVLDRLGLGAPVRAAAIARATLTSVRSLADAGEVERAQLLLQSLRDTSRAQALSPSMRADVRLEQARLHWLKGRPLAAAGAFAQALLGRPRTVLRPLKPWLGTPPHSA